MLMQAARQKADPVLYHAALTTANHPPGTWKLSGDSRKDGTEFWAACRFLQRNQTWSEPDSERELRKARRAEHVMRLTER